MEDSTIDLVRELVLRLLSSGGRSTPTAGDNSATAAVRYALRVLSSRNLPSVLPDELSLVEFIKRRLSLSGRTPSALAFADIYSKFAACAPLLNRWALLYLLNSLSLHRSRHPASSSSYCSLPFIPLQPSYAPQSAASFTAGAPAVTAGVLLVAKDPENIREIALREYADLVMEDSEVTESALVRDVLYSCQGIDGRYVRFDRLSDGYDLPESLRVPRLTRSMVRRLCELGWLFKKVRGYILDSISDQKFGIGTVGQAFCAALQEELSDYYKLLAVLESQSANPIPSAGSDSGSGSGNYLSLRRLAVWLAEPMVRMRLMAVLVDGCQELKGGAMAGAIHGYAQHGDPLVQEFMGRLLRRVCSPLFEMVRSWVLEGELEDVFSEFFILSQHVKAESLWREGYEIQSSMLPAFISPLLAQRILRTGKSINFLRVCCEDSGWVEAAAEAAAQVGATTRRGGLGYGEIDALEGLAVEAAKRIDRHLMDVIFNRYRFKNHCLAIKRYLLLGQGDFVQYLMDIIGPELSEPANSISSFQLAGLLETAIRASNAQYDDDEILDRLKVRMMDHEDGDRGWDVFSLEYEARVPLDTVFTGLNMKSYLKIFNFLWKLKRVEHALTGLWKTMKPNYINSFIFSDASFGVKLQFVSVFRRCQVLWNEMNHFVTNFQCYIMFEVLEVSWVHFYEGMDSSKDLDDLLAAHDKYLNSIMEKSLLGERSQGIIKTLYVLFDHILRFRSLADRWFEHMYELQHRWDVSRSKSKGELGKVGFLIDGGRKTIIQLVRDFFGRMSKDLSTVAIEYSAALDAFISQLPMQQHIDLKFLMFRLDFTEYYSRVSFNK